MPSETRTALRKVYFFRTAVDSDDDTEIFTPQEILRQVEALSLSDGSRYWAHSDDAATCAWVDRIDRMPARMRLGTIRRGDLPEVDQNGSLTALTLDEGAGLAEQAHICFFADGVVGLLFNFYAPRITRLSQYLKKKVPSVPHSLQFEPLIRDDTIRKIGEFSQIKLLDLRLNRSEAAILSEYDEDLTTILQAGERFADYGRLALTFQPRAYKREPIGSQRFVQRVQNLARRLRQGSADRFIVEGWKEDGSTDKLDILKDHIISEQRVVHQDNRSKALVAASAFSAIEAAYGELQASIQQASSLGGA